MKNKKTQKNNTVEDILEEIRKELRRIQTGSNVRWDFSIGLAAVIFASTLIPMKPNPMLAGIIFTGGVLAMILPPYFRK